MSSDASELTQTRRDYPFSLCTNQPPSPFQNQPSMYANSSSTVVHKSFGEALPATNSRYSAGTFDSDSFVKGQGMTIEGEIVEMRHHTLVDADTTYHRYLAVVVNVNRGNNRTFDDSGKEIETQQRRTAKARSGFSSWTETVISDPNELSLAQIGVRFGGTGLPRGWFDEGAANLHPTKENHFEVWADRNLVTDGKLKVGQTVRVKTRGISHFAEIIWPSDSTPLTAGTSYAGEDVRSGWDEKIINSKHRGAPEPEPEQNSNKDGVDDDEW